MVGPDDRAVLLPCGLRTPSTCRDKYAPSRAENTSTGVNGDRLREVGRRRGASFSFRFFPYFGCRSHHLVWRGMARLTTSRPSKLQLQL